MGLAAPPRPTSAGQRPGLPSSRPALSLAPARCLRESRWAAEVGRAAAAIQLPSGREQLPTSATGFLAAALDRLACRPRTCAAETGPGSNASESAWCKDSCKPSRLTKERLVSPANSFRRQRNCTRNNRALLPSAGARAAGVRPSFVRCAAVWCALLCHRRSVSRCCVRELLCVASRGVYDPVETVRCVDA
ncbi:hypothetical protein HPB51_017403 [Rhipicephalus microplus]|uniref:Uncharacterized protein n=1 Tax=Rhipicephalus microplus TaxID=6941 RepID=A0A9J6DAX0_RHIMP|nr:hypothetical protein HPB51_017403 [Rhipicephalus microplus]